VRDNETVGTGAGKVPRKVKEGGVMDIEVISLENVRRSREWIENYDRIQPLVDALRNSEPEESSVALFRLARKHRDWRIGQPKAVLDTLIYEAHKAGIPLNEAEKIIRAALYRPKRAETAR
jgi:hypothetical protein